MGHFVYDPDLLLSLVDMTNVFKNTETDIITMLTARNGVLRPTELFRLFDEAVSKVDYKINLEKDLEASTGEKEREILLSRIHKVQNDFAKLLESLKKYSNEVYYVLDKLLTCPAGRKVLKYSLLKYSLRILQPTQVILENETLFFSGKEEKMGDVLFSLLQKLWKGELLSSLENAFKNSEKLFRPEKHDITGEVGKQAENTFSEILRKIYGKYGTVYSGVCIMIKGNRMAERDFIVVGPNRQLLAVYEIKANPHSGFNYAMKQLYLTWKALKQGKPFYEDMKRKTEVECTYTDNTKFYLASPGIFCPFSCKIDLSPVQLRRSIILVIAHLYSTEQGEEGLPEDIFTKEVKRIVTSIIPVIPGLDYEIIHDTCNDATFIQNGKYCTLDNISVKNQHCIHNILENFSRRIHKV